jgi:hypothetical protein
MALDAPVGAIGSLDDLLSGDDADDSASSSLTVAESVPLGLIQIVPSQNVSRGGRWLPPSHPRIRRYMHSISASGLLEPVGLRILPAPVRRPCGGPCCSPEAMKRDRDSPHLTHHLCSVAYGFARLSALIGLGRDSLRLLQPRPEATVSEDMTDEQAEEACLAENVVRDEPSDYEVALALRSLARRPEYASVRSHERHKLLAERFSFPSAYRVESLLRVVERCPQDLLDEWDRESTDECRRALDQCSRLDPESLRTEEERHEAMRQTYRLLREEEERKSSGEGSGGGGSVPGRGRRVFRRRAEELLSTLDRATERYDHASGGYIPLSEEGRSAAREVLRALLSGTADAVR